LDCDAVGHKRGQCEVPGSESEHPQPEQCSAPNSDDDLSADESRLDTREHEDIPVQSNNTGGQQKKVYPLFKANAANCCETPNKGKQNKVVDRSPPTPAEDLNEDMAKNNNTKTTKKTNNRRLLSSSFYLPIYIDN